MVASKRFRMAAPSKGAPMKSSDGFELRGCWAAAEAAAAATALGTGLSEKRLGRAAAKADEVEKSPWGRMGEGFVRRAVGGCRGDELLDAFEGVVRAGGALAEAPEGPRYHGPVIELPDLSDEIGRASCRERVYDDV